MQKPRYGKTGETDLPLLHQTQLYVQLLLDDRVPDSALAVAWEEFYRVYSDLIRRFVVTRGVLEPDADDCVQEVWSAVIPRLAAFERSPHRPGLRSWLYQIVRSKVADRFRQQRRKLDNESKLAESVRGDALKTSSDPLEEFEAEWRAALLQSILSELRSDVSELNYRILWLRHCEEHDIHSVAEELGITSAQVRYRDHRMMRKLKARMAFFTGEPLGASSPESR